MGNQISGEACQIIIDALEGNDRLQLLVLPKFTECVTHIICLQQKIIEDKVKSLFLISHSLDFDAGRQAGCHYSLLIMLKCSSLGIHTCFSLKKILKTIS